MSMKEAQVLAEKGEDMKQATDHLIQLSKEQKAMLYEEGLVREEAIRLSREDYVRKEGRQEEKRQVILNMLKKGLDTSLISEVTGLSPEEIKKLQNGGS